jgi:hypothetical protein
VRAVLRPLGRLEVAAFGGGAGQDFVGGLAKLDAPGAQLLEQARQWCLQVERVGW